MSNLLAQAYLIERYGLRLNVEQLAEVLGMSAGAVRNQVSEDRFPIPTYVDQGKRFADHRPTCRVAASPQQRTASGRRRWALSRASSTR